MKLRKRQKRKTAQALDALAGVTKIWTEAEVAKKAGKGAAKAAKQAAKVKAVKTVVPSPSKKKGSLAKKLRIAGLAAVLGGAAAAIAKKLKGGGPEPIYTPPAPGEPVAPPDVDAPAAIASEPVIAT
ncbi:MAG: hypothetical protein H0W96_05450, partial [Solirubrobacterales bacterium]|nr:hypothetical protein [Solirubrobacterales bacterium]